MIGVGGHRIDLTDPLVIVALAGLAFVLLVLVMVILTRASRRTAEPLIWQMDQVGRAIQTLASGQDQLAGTVKTVSDAQATGHTAVVQALEMRLAAVQQQVNDRLHDTAMKSARSLSDMQERLNEVLHGSSEKTTKSLTELQERLATIDRAQANIMELSGNVLGLQDILSNKQTRGAFGEIQLHDIVLKALPADAFTMQATLSNNKRADCLIHLPQPPGPIVIDAKFPLEAYEALRRAATAPEKLEASRQMKTSVRAHIKAIAEKYIVEGETADGALMFLPSEAVYAELHANFPELIRDGFGAKVWIVSPTTCMATLTTMRAVLKDARMREQAGAIRATLKLLHRDVELVVERVGKLRTHFDQARKDLDEIGTAGERAGKRAQRLDNFDFEELAPETRPPLAVAERAAGR